MNHIMGMVTGEARTERIEVTDEDVGLINTLPNPPLVPVTKEDVHVRRCRLASDAIDCGFGRFRTEVLPELLKLTQGAPVLVGHRKDTAGIARFFGGEIETLEDVYNPFTGRRERISYIVPKMYWMKSHSGSEDLRLNIDGGIYNQVSISWWYGTATCGLCGKDMRACEHVPGRTYNGERAFYYYDEIQEVLEGSIVFAGGQPYTGFYLNAERRLGIAENGKIYSDGGCFLIREDDDIRAGEKFREKGTILLGENEKETIVLVEPERSGVPFILRMRKAVFRGKPCRLGSLRPAV